jgi:hypothetical protein
MMKKIFCLLLLASNLFAQHHLVTLSELKDVANQIQSHEELSFQALLSSVSHYFLRANTPYENGATGEGETGLYDQDPLVTFEALDCTTYVEVVLSLTHTFWMQKNESGEQIYEDFMGFSRFIKYKDQMPLAYEYRNHFPETQWLPDLQKKSLLQDITTLIWPKALTASKSIDVQLWYEQKNTSDLRLYDHEHSSSDLESLLHQWRNLGVGVNITTATLPYLSLEVLLDKTVQERFPDISLFNLIKGQHKKMNPPVMVSHQGFIVREKGVLYLRHASVGSKKVSQIPLNDYVKERMKDETWVTLGMNIQALLPK